MAPKKAAKREQATLGAKSGAAPATKKARVESRPEPKPDAKTSKPAPKPKTETKFNPIMSGVTKLPGMSETCRQMLLAVIPHALGPASDERQEVHEVAVQMISDALDEVVASLQHELDDLNVKAVGQDKAHDDMLVKIKDLEVVAVEAATLENDRKCQLVEAARQVSEAKAALVERRQVQQTEDAALDLASRRKATIAEVFEEHFKAIRDNELEAHVAQTHYKALGPAIDLLSLEESLTTALPSTCVKSKASRGAFDIMVLDQLEKTFVNKLSELSSFVESGSSARQERANAVQAAIVGLELLEKVHLDMTELLAAAQAALKVGNHEVIVAKQALEEREPQRLAVIKARDSKASELDNFKHYNIGNFEMLRDRVAKPPPDATTPPSEGKVVDDSATQTVAVDSEVAGPAESMPATADCVMQESGVADAATQQSPAVKEDREQPSESTPLVADTHMQDVAVVDFAFTGAMAADATEASTPRKADIAMQETTSDAPMTVGGA